MKFKTIIWNTGSAATRFRLNKKKKKIKLMSKSSSSQAGGPALKVLTTKEYEEIKRKVSGLKQLKLTSDKLIGYYRTHK